MQKTANGMQEGEIGERHGTQETENELLERGFWKWVTSGRS